MLYRMRKALRHPKRVAQRLLKVDHSNLIPFNLAAFQELFHTGLLLRFAHPGNAAAG